MDREELIRILQQHPGIAKVTEEPLPADPNEVDSIVIHFDDGTVAHMNPGLTSPLVPDETKDDLIHRIIHTVDTMKVNMTDFDPASLTNIVPLVRAADYFADHGEGSADAYGWLTDYIGFGLAIDEPKILRIINDSQLPEGHDEFDILQLQSQAIENLHTMSEYLTVSEVGLGPNVVAVSRPADNESAWFADAAGMENALVELYNQTHTTWLVIPARRNQLFFVNSDATPEEWRGLLDLLEPALDAHDCLHPLPHLIVDGQWEERLPPTDTDWGRRFRNSSSPPNPASITCWPEPWPPTWPAATRNNRASRPRRDSKSPISRCTPSTTNSIPWRKSPKPPSAPACPSPT